MTAQNPLKINFEFRDNEFYIKECNGPEELLKFNRTAFLVYQWGVWCTAWARWELQRMIDIAGDGVKTESCFLYADTDSVKYIGNIDDGLNRYNEDQKRISREHGAFAVDKKGNTHYMGVYEIEYTYELFRTWGAKRYAYQIDGEIFVTTAGVVKRSGKENNVGGKELAAKGGLQAYKPGFTFVDAGGSEAVYNDNVNLWVTVDGHDLHITDNVSILPSSYTLGITGEYEFLLDHVEFMYDLWNEFKRDREVQK